ncbi:MAG: Carboxymethylenebutenolidase, partial [Pseudomonadota bacterium]
DKYIPMDGVQAFAQTHPEVQVQTYNAHHGFNCDQRGAWDAPSAQLARERSQAFFAKHLG